METSISYQLLTTSYQLRATDYQLLLNS